MPSEWAGEAAEDAEEATEEVTEEVTEEGAEDSVVNETPVEGGDRGESLFSETVCVGSARNCVQVRPNPRKRLW